MAPEWLNDRSGACFYKCNILLTIKLLRAKKLALPLHPVISFSVINYVVSMRHPRESDEVSFFLYQHINASQLAKYAKPSAQKLAQLRQTFSFYHLFTPYADRSQPKSGNDNAKPI